MTSHDPLYFSEQSVCVPAILADPTATLEKSPRQPHRPQEPTGSWWKSTERAGLLCGCFPALTAERLCCVGGQGPLGRQRVTQPSARPPEGAAPVLVMEPAPP